MDTLLQLGLSNALSAAVLALAAAGVSRIARRPPLTRALWLLVLLKLVTPPLWTIHLPLHSMQPHSAVTRIVEAHQNSIRDDSGAFATPTDAELVIPFDVTRSPAAVSPPPARHPAPPNRWQTLLREWPLVVVVVWLGGSGLYLLAILLMAARLRRLLRHARPATPDVLGRISELSNRLGLHRAPQACFTELPVTPMLCAIGMSPRLVLPLLLWERLTDAERDVVLAHELAHLRRKDHYIRAFELIVSGLYWWHPAVWWARRQLREATEQCCDAWVLWAMPRSGRSYAAALIQAIEYLSSTHVAVPALASGMGQFHDLRRRLVMIHRGTVGRALSWPAFVAVSGAAGLLLPLSPGIAAPPEAPVAVSQEAGSLPTPAPETDGGGGGSAAVSVAPAPETNGGGAGPAPVSVAPAAESTAAGTALAPVNAFGRSEASEAAQIDQARAEVDQLRARLQAAEARLAAIEHRRPGAAAHMSGRVGSASRDGALEAYGRIYNYGANHALAGASAEQRLDALQHQVEQILHELRQMRQNLGGGNSAPPETEQPKKF